MEQSKRDEIVLRSLIDAICVMDMPKETFVALIREIIERKELSFADCFPSEKEALAKVCAKYEELWKCAEAFRADVISLLPTGTFENTGCKPAAVSTKKQKTQPSAKASQTSSVKGYSRNGKKLGRPSKKTAPAADKEKNAEEAGSDGTEKCSPSPAPNADNKAEAGISVDLPGPEENKEKTPPSLPPEVDAEGFTSQEREEIEKLKMGKEYSFDILYKWQGKMVVSNRIMQEGTPLGVFVPYTRKTVGYAKFVLYYTDEISGLSLNKASAYARNKLPAYKGEKWKILDSWQIEAAKQAQPELNQLLKKIGGDPFIGSYLVPKVANYHKMPDKIRYAVNVH